MSLTNFDSLNCLQREYLSQRSSKQLYEANPKRKSNMRRSQKGCLTETIAGDTKMEKKERGGMGNAEIC
jgi:hypothetical protein